MRKPSFVSAIPITAALLAAPSHRTASGAEILTLQPANAASVYLFESVNYPGGLVASFVSVYTGKLEAGYAQTQQYDPMTNVTHATIQTYAAHMEFDLSAIPAGETIVSAQFSVERYGGLTNPITYDLYAYPDADGQVTAADYQAGQNVGTAFGSQNVGLFASLSHDVTAYTQSLAAPDGSHYIGFEIASHGSSYPGEFNAAGTANGPSLVLTLEQAIPEPSSMALLGAAAGAIFSRRRRR